MKVTHKVYNGGAAGLLDRIKALGKKRIAVGIPSQPDKGKAQNTDDEMQDTKQGENDTLSNADLLYIHTNGVRKRPMREEMQPDIDNGTKYSIALQMYIKSHGSVAMQVPARPVVEPAIEKHMDDIAEIMEMCVETAAKGGDVDEELSLTGQQARDFVKNYFEEDNGWAPNSPATIKRKHSDNPLIDTGALRQAITFVVDDGND